MTYSRVFKQLAWFAAVGVTATLTHFATAMFALSYFACSLLCANLLGYCLAVAVSIFGHSYLTFRSRLTRQVVQRFLVVSLVTLLISQGLLASIQDMLPSYVALALAVVVIPALTFVLNKLWVFTLVRGH